MKITIIGAGVVGKATGLGLARFGHDVAFGDINPQALDQVRDMGYLTWLCEVGDVIPAAEVYFICTPEDAVARVARILKEVQGDLVIRSSTFPGTTEGLAGELHRAVFHNPEFLREANAQDDFLYTRVAILGRGGAFRPLTGNHLESVYRHMGMRVVWTSATISELVKLTVNNYLATLISYWNEVHLLCQRLGVNSHNLARIATMDPRVTAYGAYKHGECYGGKCLPKDMDRMLGFYREKGVEPVLLEAVKAINNSVAEMRSGAVEAHQSHKLEVGGSSPSSATKEDK